MRRLKRYRDHLADGKSNLELSYLTEDSSYRGAPLPFKGALEALVAELKPEDPVKNHKLCADYVRRAHQSLVPILDMYEATNKGKDKSEDISKAVNLFVSNIHQIVRGEEIETGEGYYYFWSKDPNEYKLIFCGPDLKGVKEALPEAGISVEPEDLIEDSGFQFLRAYVKRSTYQSSISESPVLMKFAPVEAEPNLGFRVEFNTLKSHDKIEAIIAYCQQKK